MGRLKRESKPRADYGFRTKPGGSFVVGGFFAPESAGLKPIRVDIDQHLETLWELLTSKRMTDTFGEIRGDGVRIAPRGHAKDHPGVDLPHRTPFLFWHPFTDPEACASDFMEKMDTAYRNFSPFVVHMSEVLTTDQNPISIVRSK